MDLISISLNNLLDNFRGHSRGWNIHNKGSLPQDSQIVFCHIGFSTSSSFSNCRGVPFFIRVVHIVICDIAFLFVQHALVNIAGGKLWSLVNSRSHSLHLNFLLDTRDHDCRHTLQDHKKKVTRIV